MKTHFVYAGWYYLFHESKLSSFILKEMKKHNIMSVMITRINMARLVPAKKERMQSNGKGQELVQHSVNDDLDSFFGDLRPGNGLSEQVMTYFIPKLTEEDWFV